MKLMNLLVSYFTNRVQGSLFSVLAPIGPLVKQLSLGLGSIVMGIVCFLFTIFFLALSFFFLLIDKADWSVSGLWTCLVLGLIGLVLTLVGRSIITNSNKLIS
ncbi:hypothetical protein KBD34_02900 [Patescibacteria group bacterium]|nr:hypothetical protein [Patescibacteria group bacterium]